MLTAHYFKLDEFLDNIADLSVFESNGLYPKNKLDTLPKKIKTYKRKIKELEDKNDIFSNNASFGKIVDFINEHNNLECYTHNIVLEGGDFYNLTWSIAKSSTVIKKNKIQPKGFEVNQLVNRIAPEAVNWNNIEAVDNNNPIYIVEVHPYILKEHPPYIIIDGNHRLASSYLQKKKQIQAYIIPKELIYECFFSELDLVLYKINCNIHVIVDYLFGSISKNKMKKTLWTL